MVAMRSSHPVFLLTTFYLLNITYALPANSLPILQLQNTTFATATTANESLSIPTVTTPLHAGRSVECFAPDTPVTASVTVEDCDFVFEVILRDPAGVMAMTTFSHRPALFEYGVPAQWSVGGCVVILTSANETMTDRFQLADVIVKAREIIAICPGQSKTHLGGIALIGHRKTFFVAVNGPHDDPDDPVVDGREGSRNGTRLVLAQGWGRSGMTGVEERVVGIGREVE